jgi:hypothetical protein
MAPDFSRKKDLWDYREREKKMTVFGGEAPA